MDFDNIIESEYPKNYLPQHDDDIRKILYVNNIDNLDTKKNISFDNFKLLLELMKNKKSEVYEKNFYMDEYSTDFDKIKGNNLSLGNKYANIDYLDLFKGLLPFKSDK